MAVGQGNEASNLPAMTCYHSLILAQIDLDYSPSVWPGILDRNTIPVFIFAWKLERSKLMARRDHSFEIYRKYYRKS